MATELHAVEALSPVTKAVLEMIQTLVPAMTAVVGGLWIAYTYVDHQREENRTRLIEAQKPFAEKQLALFMEAGKVAGQLSAFDKSTPGWLESKEWKDAYIQFYQLFWTELSIVEDEPVKNRMQEFSRQLHLVVKSPENHSEWDELNQSAYRLARQIRSSIEDAWKLKLGQVDDFKRE